MFSTVLIIGVLCFLVYQKTFASFIHVTSIFLYDSIFVNNNQIKIANEDLQGETKYYFYVLEDVFRINSLIDNSSRLKGFPISYM